jgi:putative flippase GtrA
MWRIRRKLTQLLSSLDKRRIFRFAVVGVGGTVLYFGVLLLLVEGLRMEVTAASSVAFVCVVLQNYYLHYVWTFQSDTRHGRAMPLFFLMSATGLLLNWLIMHFGAENRGFNYLLVQAMSIAVVVAWNMAISYLYVFRKPLPRDPLG